MTNTATLNMSNKKDRETETKIEGIEGKIETKFK